MHWNPKEKASGVWYLLGLVGVGYLIGLIYVLISDDKNRVWSLFYLLGWIGSIVLYFVFKDKDPKLADMSVKLLIGNIILLVIIGVVWVVLLALFGAALSSAGGMPLY